MGLSRAFWFFATCCLACRDAFGGSNTSAGVFASINDTPQGRMPDVEDTRIGRSIGTRNKQDGITLRDGSIQFETSQESPPVEDPSAQTSTSSDLRRARCSRYCIQQLGTGKDRSLENINLFWSFAGNDSEDILLVENNPKLKISKRTSTVNKNLTALDNDCQIYLDLGCDVVNMRRNPINHRSKFVPNLESIYQNTEITEYPFQSAISGSSKTLVHRINLSGYTETKFYINANITEIVVNIWGNLTRAILAIPTNKTTQRPGIKMSLARTYDTKGVAIGARNPPQGGWCVKLTGVENTKYNFDVIARYGEASEENDTKREIIGIKSTSTEENFYRTLDKESTRRSEAIINKIKKSSIVEEETRQNTDRNDSILMNSGVNKKSKFVFERSVEIIDTTDNTEKMADDLSDALPSSTHTATENIITDSSSRDKPSASYGDFRIPQNASNNKTIFNEKMFTQQQEKIQARSSEVASLNEDFDVTTNPFINASLNMLDSGKSQDLSERTPGREDIFGRRKTLIELNPNSNLFATPGTIHRLLFDVANNCFLMVRYEMRVRSSTFRYNVLPRTVWLYPGQSTQVAVDIIIPAGTSRDTVNTLSLYIGGTEISEKTVYIYVQDGIAKSIDDERPTIDYSFNNNCGGKLRRDRCDKTFWSADITVQDTDSGLKNVISSPSGVYPRTEFISGTKDSVRFSYMSTCCSTTARITAIDLSNNQHTRTIDVTAWDNLSEGEIAAITVGALLLLLLLILVIIGIVYCVRKRNSHDLPYTQRYGSRQPPGRTERTSF